MIPRIIHQLWKTRDLPPDLREFQKSWIHHHPAWEYHLWTDEDNERLIHEHYPQFEETFRTLTPNIVKIDFIRLAYMHRFGGVYADLDFEVLRPLDSLFADGRIAVGVENGGIGVLMQGRPFIINALIASPAAHPAWLKIMQAMADQFHPRRWFETHALHVSSMTIEIFHQQIEAYVSDHVDITVHPSALFYPAPPAVRFADERRRMAAQMGSYAIHHYANTWVGYDIRLINAVEKLRQRWARFWRR